jgi:hypothetical protein
LCLCDRGLQQIRAGMMRMRANPRSQRKRRKRRRRRKKRW